MRRVVLAIGPVALTMLFLVRTVSPTVDVTLLMVGFILAAATVAMVFGSRLGSGVVLLLGLSLFQPITAREFSFSLSSVDSEAWRLWAIGSLLALGWSLVSSALVVGGVADRAPAAVVVGVSSVVGVVLIPVFAALAPQPGFGSDLSDAEMASLPVIEMLNYRYEPPIVALDSGERYLARVENPSSLPHTITVEALDIEVFVPAGRWSILEIDGTDLIGARSLDVICTVGDHRDRGMVAVLEIT